MKANCRLQALAIETIQQKLSLLNNINNGVQWILRFAPSPFFPLGFGGMDCS